MTQQQGMTVKAVWMAALAVLGMGVTGHGAWAANSQVSAQFLGVELLDLDPDDGVAPSITFDAAALFNLNAMASNQAYSYNAAGDFVEGARNGWAMDGTYGGSIPGPAQASATLYTLSTQAQGSQQGLQGMVVSAQGQGVGYEAGGLNMSHPYAYGVAQYQGGSSGNWSFSLSANTLATFRFAGSSSVTASGGDYGFNQVSMQVFTYGTDSAARQLYDPGSFTYALTVGNLQSRAVSGGVTLAVQTLVQMNSPVPEPDALALVLAGVGVVGVWGARQRVRAARA